ncbi:hypothetical protein VL01_18460 [Aeromonas enteropelogenes]|nr:hypothetical protein VL01_18460 [Aeromonas enteropelogenes]
MPFTTINSLTIHNSNLNEILCFPPSITDIASPCQLLTTNRTIGLNIHLRFDFLVNLFFYIDIFVFGILLFYNSTAS